MLGIWLGAIAFSIACLVLGVINLRRRRRAWGIGLVALGLLVFVVPLTTVSVRIEFPPAEQR